MLYDFRDFWTIFTIFELFLNKIFNYFNILNSFQDCLTNLIIFWMIKKILTIFTMFELRLSRYLLSIKFSSRKCHQE